MTKINDIARGIDGSSEFQAQEGNDADQFGSQASPVDGTSYDLISYAVPAGKTLYVTDISIAAVPTVADKGIDAMAYANLNSTVKGNVFFGYERGGWKYHFVKPRVFEAADTVKLTAHQDSGQNLTGSLAGVILGYLL